MPLQCLPIRIMLVVFTMLASFNQCFAGDTIPWSTDIEGSLQKAASSGQPVLLEFTADWCMYCKRMEKTTFVDPRVVNFVNQHYVAVRVDADEHKQLVTDLDIKGLPAILIVSPTLQIIDRIPGFQTPDALLAKLNKNSQSDAKQVAHVPNVNKPPQQPVAARPASAAVSGRARLPQQELQFEPIETEQPAAVEEATEEEARPEFEVAEAQESFEPAAEEAPEEEMPAEPTESTVSAEEEDFFATVSQQKVPEQKTVAQKIVPAELVDEPEFEGHCLVTAVESREIVDGSSRHQTKYRGHLLYFSSEEAKQAFLAHPNEYWPLFDGICSVAMLNDEERVTGKLEYAAFFRKRLWLFSTEENLKQFLEDPADVAEEMQELAEARSAR